MDLLVGLRGRRKNTVDEALHGSLDGRQRRAQFMADIRDQIPPPGFDLIQLLRRIVEPEGRSSSSLDIDPFLIVAGGYRSAAVDRPAGRHAGSGSGSALGQPQAPQSRRLSEHR
jgi:hypothetical protein